MLIERFCLKQVFIHFSFRGMVIRSSMGSVRVNRGLMRACFRRASSMVVIGEYRLTMNKCTTNKSNTNNYIINKRNIT